MGKEKKIKDDLMLHSAPKVEYDMLNHDQKRAVKMVDDWFYSKKTKDNTVLRLGGPAGSGKGFIIRYLVNHYHFKEDECYAVAYTGQAVNVLRQNGIMAKTIHSTFMKAREVPMLDKNGSVIFRSGIPVMRTKFKPVRSIPSTVKLVICDEASFLPETLQAMILKYNVPILEVGDPIQLPPVAGKQCFNMSNLDFMLDQIMRQEQNSEIIDLSMKIRYYEPIDTAQYHDQVRFLWAQEDMEETFFRFKPFIKGSDMIVTATNKQRNTINSMYREHVLHATSPYPMKGERLICRKNDWNTTLGPFPLTNGTQGYAKYTVGKSEIDKNAGIFMMDFQPDFITDDYFDGLMCDTKFLRDDAGNKDMSYYEQLNPGKKFEYAHAISTHLAQGSQADQVMFFDSFGGDAEYHMRLRYTAVTRAVNRLYYVLPYSKNYKCWTDLWKGGFRE